MSATTIAIIVVALIVVIVLVKLISKGGRVTEPQEHKRVRS